MLLILDGCSFRSILPESEVLSWIWIVLDFPYVENVIAPLSMSSLQNQTVYWPSALSTSFSWDGVWGARLQRCTMVMTPHSSCASPGISVGHYKVFPHILSHSTKQSSFQTWLWEHPLQGTWWKVGGWVMGWLCEPSSSRATKPNQPNFQMKQSGFGAANRTSNWCTPMHITWMCAPLQPWRGACWRSLTNGHGTSVMPSWAGFSPVNWENHKPEWKWSCL